MGAAYDAMCENEGLQSTINKKNRQLREQKKLLIEFSEGIIRYLENCDDKGISDLHNKATKTLAKLNKKK